MKWKLPEDKNCLNISNLLRIWILSANKIICSFSTNRGFFLTL